MLENLAEIQEGSKRKILPIIVGLLQGYFFSQILTSSLALLIILALGFSNTVGVDVFYGIGLAGYGVSIILLTIAMVYLVIGMRRLDEQMLDYRNKKYGRCLAGLIFTLILIIAGIVPIAVVPEEPAAFLVFVIVNVVAYESFILNILLKFNRSLRLINNRQEETKDSVEDLIPAITVVVLIVGLVAGTLIIYYNTNDSVMMIDRLMIMQLVGMLIFGATGELYLSRKKKKWIIPKISS